ncbi:hypothetical protein OnM2_044065 [Erysiphe neolycopersici]|uniref:Uncharacterized protein n=1 Tax=Erysiphe neolycopersici TaxID=212602 RepID=A0A420HUT2_9PEZI|nr:hypothetical protein OnM2_044065 [Erysiphe neolycopersici]
MTSIIADVYSQTILEAKVRRYRFVVLCVYKEWDTPGRYPKRYMEELAEELGMDFHFARGNYNIFHSYFFFELKPPHYIIYDNGEIFNDFESGRDSELELNIINLVKAMDSMSTSSISSSYQ